MQRSTTTGPVTTSELVALGRTAGLAAVGVAGAEVLEPARTVLHIRKRAGLAGDMQFTYRNPDRSTDPSRLLPGARSLVAGAWSYGGMGRPAPDPESGDVARYAWHDHYDDLRRALEAIAGRLRDEGHRATVVADSNALVDRNAAWSAGIGWYGKNSNLLLPGAGSWFVLGAVVTDAELEPTGPPLADGCSSCSRCIDDCPTDAIVAPGVVDARRCLAWIVQAGGPIPLRYRTAIGNRIYGCDDCQTVCPPNWLIDRTATTTASAPAMAATEQASVDLHWVLTASDEDVLDRHGRWYIADRNVDVIRRTALVVLGNVATPAGRPLDSILRTYLAHRNPVLRSHAAWAARRLGRTDLLDIVATDPDPTVRAELSTAVEARFDAADWAG